MFEQAIIGTSVSIAERMAHVVAARKAGRSSMKILRRCRGMQIALATSLFLITGRSSATQAHSSDAHTAQIGYGTPSQTRAAGKEMVNLVIAVDSSGSMAARVRNKRKLDIAKEVLGTLVEQIPGDVQTGLRVYGHRSKDDCRDTELLVSIGPIQKEKFRQRIERMRPLGQTPIAYSLSQAVEDLKGRSGKKVIILVSDGEETCGGDPCKLAADFKKADIDFRVHVIGFDIVKAAARKQLSCIAQATGGLYLDAKDAGQLLSSLQSAVQASTKVGGKGKLVTTSPDYMGRELKWNIAVFPAGAPEGSPYILGIGDSREPNELPPGKYDLKYVVTASYGRSHVWRRGVEIKAGQETKVVIEKFGRLQVIPRDLDGFGCYIYRGGTQEQVATLYENIADLPAGVYDLLFWKVGWNLWRRGVVIKAGQQTKVEVTANR